jgi:N4-(beta-N-acetylglucosaminyl)-L-asparaginase
VKRIVERDPKAAKDLQVGFVAISKRGEVGAYAIQKGFTYSVTNAKVNKTFPSASHFG